eukprot:gene9758-4619_t
MQNELAEANAKARVSSSGSGNSSANRSSVGRGEGASQRASPPPVNSKSLLPGVGSDRHFPVKNAETGEFCKHLRGYGQNDGTFSFETGRKSSDPEKTYFFEVQGNQDLFAELNLVVAEHNGGVGGDRYDHIPAGGFGAPAAGQEMYATANHNGGGAAAGHEMYATANHGAKNRAPPAGQETYAVAQHGGGGGGGGGGQDMYAVAQHGGGNGNAPAANESTYATAQHGNNDNYGEDNYG